MIEKMTKMIVIKKFNFAFDKTFCKLRKMKKMISPNLV